MINNNLQQRQKVALKIAKYSILEEFDKIYSKDVQYRLNQAQSYPQLLQQRASFVTLKIWWKDLRWCIWSIVATRPLYEDIYINAKNAAFSDPRFSPLEQQEVKNLFLEITVLSPLKSIKFNSVSELLKYLAENKPGLVIKLDWYSATFLPSVWNELPDPEQFLVHLIYKAGLTPEIFVQNFDKVEIFVYTWEEFWDWFSNI